MKTNQTKRAIGLLAIGSLLGAMLAGCAGNEKHAAVTAEPGMKLAGMQQANLPGSAPPQASASPSTGEAQTAAPLAPRVTGASAYGEWRIVPAAAETIEREEAASCVAREGDYRFRSSRYDAVFVDKKGNATVVQENVFAGLVAGSQESLRMEPLKLADAELFYIVPEQSCHGGDLHLFGVDAGGRPFAFRFEPQGGASMLRGVTPYVKDGKLYVPAEVNAGAAEGAQDIRSFYLIYKPDISRHVMVLDGREEFEYRAAIGNGS